jgi:hypothetical protein
METELAAALERLGRLEGEQARLRRQNRRLRWAAAAAFAVAAVALAVSVYRPHPPAADWRGKTVEAEVVKAQCLVIEGGDTDWRHLVAWQGPARRAVLFTNQAEAVLRMESDQSKAVAELRVGQHATVGSISTEADRVDRASLKLTGYDGEAGASLEAYPGLVWKETHWEAAGAARVQAGGKGAWWEFGLDPDREGKPKSVLYGPDGEPFFSRP